MRPSLKDQHLWQRVKASVILDWVLKESKRIHGVRTDKQFLRERDVAKPFPLPRHFEIIDDISVVPAWIFDEREWCSILKADFAAQYDVCESQVTRWIKGGMPVQSDGRFNWREAHRWLETRRSTWLFRKHGLEPVGLSEITKLPEDYE